jgi:hypothetical protein
LAALTRDPVGQQIIAQGDTEVFEVFMDDMEEVFEDSFPILVTVIRGMARGVLETRLRIPGTAGFSSETIAESRRGEKLGLVERILFTRHLIAYGKARVEAIAELAREMEERRLPAGSVLWEENDPAPFQYLIYSGVVDCSTSKGHQFAFGANSVIGGIDSMSDAPRWYRAVARTDMLVLRSDVTHLIDVIEDHPDMGVDMLRVLAGIMLAIQAAGDRDSGSSWARSDAP